MQIRRILFGVLAVAVAFAFAPLQTTQAASLLGPGSQPATENLIDLAQAKAKPKAKAKAKAKGKRASSKAGRCGTGKYWKKGACQAAADKK